MFVAKQDEKGSWGLWYVKGQAWVIMPLSVNTEQSMNDWIPNFQNAFDKGAELIGGAHSASKEVLIGT